MGHQHGFATRPYGAILSEDQVQQFENTGLLLVKNAFDPKSAEAVSADIWDRLATMDIHRGNPESWSRLDERQLRVAIKRTRKIKGLQCVYSDQVLAIVDQLTDSEFKERAKPLLLLTFSNQHDYLGDSQIPSRMWHSDAPHLPGKGLSGIIVLGFLNRVEPRGGGTMVIQGSHRLFEESERPIPSRVVRRRLKKHALMRDLFTPGAENRDRYLKETTYVDGAELKVVELVGNPGDAWFVDAGCLHTITRNYLDEPRMMVRGFFNTPKLREHYEEMYPDLKSKWSERDINLEKIPDATPITRK